MLPATIEMKGMALDDARGERVEVSAASEISSGVRGDYSRAGAAGTLAPSAQTLAITSEAF